MYGASPVRVFINYPQNKIERTNSVKKFKLSFILLLLVAISMIFSACQPKEVFLTTSNVSDFLEFDLVTTQEEGKLEAVHNITITSKKDMIYKDVEITYRLESKYSSWKSTEDTIKLSQDGCISITDFTTADLLKQYDGYNYVGYDYEYPSYTFEIVEIFGSVISN